MSGIPKRKTEQFDKKVITMNDETSSELTTTSSSPLALAVKRINELHLEAETIAQRAKDLAYETIAVALECGRLLHEQKKQVKHGSWEDWCNEHLNFDIRTAQRYMSLFRKSAELGAVEPKNASKTTQAQSVSFLGNAKVKTLRQAYIATGILPEAVKVEDDSFKHTPQCEFVRWIDKLVIWYRKRTENDPIEDWESKTRKLLINELRPWVKIYNELVELNEDE